MRRLLIALSIVSLLILAAGCDHGGSLTGFRADAGRATAVVNSRTQNLVNGTITVKLDSYYSVPFTINANMRSVAVSGTFKASGGSGNDIRVLVMDETAFTNWVNNHDVAAIYDSGKLTTQSIKVNIEGVGQYRLVFDNRFSVLSNKQVTTQVDLTWDELVLR